MSKKEFLKSLKRRLRALPADEREKALSYYSELIDDRTENGSTEEAAVDALGTIPQIADEILSEAEKNGTRLKKSMPKGVKTLLIVLAALFGLAAVASAALTVSGHFIVGDSLQWQKLEDSYDLSSTGRIETDFDIYSLSVGVSKDEKVHIIRWENPTVGSFKTEQFADGIKFTQRTKPFMGFMTNIMYKSCTLLVPESFAGELVLSVTTGDLTVEGISGPSVDAKATTGDLELKNCSFPCIAAGCTTGDVIIDSCSVGKGDFAGRSDGLLGTVTVNGTTADVNLKSVEAADSINIKVTTGEILLSGIASEKLSVKTTTGDVNLYKCECNDTEINTTTGSIKGTMTGAITDYTIESDNTTGKNLLPESMEGGDKKLSVHATTGDILIKFEKAE